MVTKDYIDRLVKLLVDFNSHLEHGDIRDKVIELLPAYKLMTTIGVSLIPDGIKIAARERILRYMLRYPGIVIQGKELLLVSGISEWARRVRELRVQFGWAIINGLTVKAMIDAAELELADIDTTKLTKNNYVLISSWQDKESAYRWNMANEIRKKKVGMQEKLLLYFQENVGKRITGDELQYVAEGSEWARRVRELRTEEGWPISTKMNGRPDLPSGVYMLEENRQIPKHDRKIKDSIRREVLSRDNFRCTKCGWNYDMQNKADTRILEIHHQKRHVDGGTSDAANLVTLCNVCHDLVHTVTKTGLNND
jgi:hypothetical protein